MLDVPGALDGAFSWNRGPGGSLAPFLLARAPSLKECSKGSLWAKLHAITMLREFHARAPDRCFRNVFQQAYLHHLHRANEPLLGQLASVHNLHRVNALMGELRQGILDGKV